MHMYVACMCVCVVVVVVSGSGWVVVWVGEITLVDMSLCIG